MSPTNIRCAYCGDKATEWDHLNPIIRNQEPTGFIAELANSVPACGKCNQSKGASQWSTWITGPAKLSPKSRGIPDVEQRIERLHAYESRHIPTKVDFPAIVGPEMWKRHRQNWRDILDLLKVSQGLAAEIRLIVSKAN